MTLRAPSWRLLLFVLLSISFAGCSQFRRGTLDDEKDPYYLEGKKRYNEMDYDGAIESYERALQSNPKNAAAHLELGLLYDRKKNDPAAAIYHYQRHLALHPNSNVAEPVKQNIIGCMRELAKNVPYAALTRDVQQQIEKLNLTNTFLMQRLQTLQAELARRPEYVTNFVTNFVTLPQFDQKSSSGLTKPAQLVSSIPDTEEEAAPEPQPQPEHKRAEPERPQPKKPEPKKPEPKPAKTTAHTSTRGAKSTPAAATRGSVHTVRPGETLAVLARKYGVSLRELKAANPDAASGVRSGQTIKIPGK